MSWLKNEVIQKYKITERGNGDTAKNNSLKRKTFPTFWMETIQYCTDLELFTSTTISV